MLAFPTSSGALLKADLNGPVKSSRVVLVIAPFVTWADITPQTTPHIFKAAQTGAIGDINARSRAKEDNGMPSIGEGALTISSGSWALVDSSAYSAFDATENFELGSAGDAYARIMGTKTTRTGIVYLGLPKILAANAENSFQVVPGALGSAIQQAGGSTAAIGNSDLGYATDAERTIRPAAMAAMNEDGAVEFGEVSEDMLRRDSSAPYGVRTDVDAIFGQLAQVSSKMDPAKPGLIVVDSGDLYRAHNYAANVTEDAAKVQWNAALKSLDEVYARAQGLYPDDTVILAAQAAKDPKTDKEGFGPIIVPNMTPGVLESASTQRPGLVTNLDLTATILDILDVKQPIEALGSPMQSTPQFSIRLLGHAENTAADRFDLLKKMNATALAIENNRVIVLNIFIIFTVMILILGAIVIIRAPKHWSRASVKIVRRALRLLILAVLCVPVSSWLMFLVYRWPGTPLRVTAQLVAVAVALWLLTVGLIRHLGSRVPLIFLAAVTSVVIIVDQLLGAPASFTSFFGYSPIAAARFYGIGNEGAAVLFGAAIIAVVMALDQWPHARFAEPMRKWGIPIIGFIVMFVSAAPMLGANVGVAIWATVGFVLLWILCNDKKITWKYVALIVALVVLVVGSFLLVDKFGGGQETHLARSVDSAQQGGIIQLWDIVVRKVETNVRVLTHTNLVWILLAVIGYLGLMRWRPTGDFADTLRRNPRFADGMTAILIAGAVAYLSEDSGVVLPALMVLYLGCGIVWLMLDEIKGEDKRVR